MNVIMHGQLFRRRCIRTGVWLADHSPKQSHAPLQSVIESPRYSSPICFDYSSLARLNPVFSFRNCF